MPASTLLRRPALVLVLGLCAIAAVTTLLGRFISGPQIQTKPAPLSGVDGSVAYPAFSADGNRLAYSERGALKDDTYHIFVRHVPTGAVTQLTNGAANDISPAWSPDGARIAFLRVNESKAQCIAMPSAGGAENVIAEFPAAESEQPLPALSWSPDGQTLAAVMGAEKQPAAIALISVANGKVRPVTTPPESSDGDWSPAFSPDGSKLAFVRAASADGADLYLADANGGNPRRMSFDEDAVRGIAWAPGGVDLIYASTRGGGNRLWRIPAIGGSPHEVIGTGNQARYPAVSTAGNRLAYTESPTVTSIWRAPMGLTTDTGAGAAGRASSGDGAENDGGRRRNGDNGANESSIPRPNGERVVLRSNGREALASYSPDGKRIADISDQTGFEEIWVSDAEGNGRVQVTNFTATSDHPHLGRAAWSPDGKWLLFDESGDRGDEVWKVPAEAAGKSVRVLTGGHGGSWSHDGKSIYYSQNGQIWKATPDGGHPKQITERGSNGAAAESLDGKFVYFRFRGASIWRVPSSGGEAEPAVDAEGPLMGDPMPVKGGVYYVVFDRFDRAMTVTFYDFAVKKSSAVFRLPSRNNGFSPVFSISPDGKFILFARVDQSLTNLLFVENFK